MILSGPEDAATEDVAVTTGLKRVPNKGFEQDPGRKCESIKKNYCPVESIEFHSFDLMHFEL